MTKIVDYKIITDSKNSSLENRVCEAISFDWVPYHGPYLDRNGIEKQAMIKYDDGRDDSVDPYEITQEETDKLVADFDKECDEKLGQSVIDDKEKAKDED